MTNARLLAEMLAFTIWFGVVMPLVIGFCLVFGLPR